MFLETASKLVVGMVPEEAVLFSGAQVKHSPGGQKLLGACVAATDEQETDWLLTKVPKMAAFFDRLLKINRQMRILPFQVLRHSKVEPCRTLSYAGSIAPGE
jgi:hypothetical protein